MYLLIVGLILFNFGSCNSGVDYGDLASWPDVCQTGVRQSPINIETNGVGSPSA